MLGIILAIFVLKYFCIGPVEGVVLPAPHFVHFRVLLEDFLDLGLRVRTLVSPKINLEIHVIYGHFFGCFST